MCGNGIRCMAKFLLELESAPANSEKTYKIWTNAGVIVPKITKDGYITVDMGEPIVSPPEKVLIFSLNRICAIFVHLFLLHLYANLPQIPTTLAATKDGKVIDATIEALGCVYKSNAVSMGNPHNIIFVDDLEAMNPPFSVIGPVMEKHPAFPQRVNTEFTQVIISAALLLSLTCAR